MSFPKGTVAWCDEMRLRGEERMGKWGRFQRTLELSLTDSNNAEMFNHIWIISIINIKPPITGENQWIRNSIRGWVTTVNCDAMLRLSWIMKDLRQGSPAYHQKILHWLPTWAKSHVIELWLRKCQKCEGYRRDSARNRERRADNCWVKRSVR